MTGKMYLVRRTDTGEYFRQLSSGYLKDWAVDDPRRKNWTLDIEKAKPYSLNGAISVASNQRNDCSVEVVRLKITVDEVVRTWNKGIQNDKVEAKQKR